MKSLLLVLLGHVAPVVAVAQNMPDPNLWLEDVSGDAALNWVRGQDGGALTFSFHLKQLR